MKKTLEMELDLAEMGILRRIMGKQRTTECEVLQSGRWLVSWRFEEPPEEMTKLLWTYDEERGKSYCRKDASLVDGGQENQRKAEESLK